MILMFHILYFSSRSLVYFRVQYFKNKFSHEMSFYIAYKNFL